MGRGWSKMVKHIPFRFVDDRPVGPIVNVAFTIDGECLDLLHQAGKNRSRTVRNAIKFYLKGDQSFQDLAETHDRLLQNFSKVCLERDELRKTLSEINNSYFGKVDLEPKNEDSFFQGFPKLRKLIIIFLKGLRQLLKKNRKQSSPEDPAQKKQSSTSLEHFEN